MSSPVNKVIIEVRDGVVEIAEAPQGLDIEIRDYDMDFYEDDDLEEDEFGDKYFLREA
jgi:hypothetical protein